MPQGFAFSIQNNFTTADMARTVFQQFGPPYVVKPPSDGASVGIIVADSIVVLPDAIGDILDAYGAVLVEEFIRGHDATVGIIEDFRNEELYALPPAHILAPLGARRIEWDHYNEELLKHTVPSNFSDEHKSALIEMARVAHRTLGLSHFSRADFILTTRGPYLLEVNSIPGLYPNAAFPHMLESVGSSIREFAEHAIALARGI